MELLMTVDQYNEFANRRELLYQQILKALNSSGLGTGELQQNHLAFNYANQSFKIVGLLGANHEDIHFTTYKLTFDTSEYPNKSFKKIDFLKSRMLNNRVTVNREWSELKYFGLKYLEQLKNFMQN